MADQSSPDIILPLVILIFIVFTILLVIYYAGTSSFTTNDTAVSITCGQDQCATNLQSGFKRCPPLGGTINADPRFEVCNSRYSCDNPTTPFAVNSDGSTNIFGVCETETECPCVVQFQCPSYNSTYFTVLDGNIYNGFNGQRIVIPQELTEISISDPGSAFCAIPVSWLPYTSPGCSFISEANPTLEQIITCMNGAATPTTSAVFSPCLQGILAFVTSDSTDIVNNFATTNLACVQGTSCPVGQINVYDTNLGAIVCW